MLKRLNEVNDVKVYHINDEEFKTFGGIITGIDVTKVSETADKVTTIPDNGNIYVASEAELEKAEEFAIIKNEIYGGLDIQFGYCNGRNDTYNGLEYHKGSEVIVAVTDFMLVLGRLQDMENNTFDVNNVKVFFVPKGSVVELYQTTLHLSPCKVTDDGFKAIIILPRGTNTPLDEKVVPKTNEGKILLMKNKWIIAHKDREPLIKNGAVAGLLGENKKLNY